MRRKKICFVLLNEGNLRFVSWSSGREFREYVKTLSFLAIPLRVYSECSRYGGIGGRFVCVYNSRYIVYCVSRGAYILSVPQKGRPHGSDYFHF